MISEMIHTASLLHDDVIDMSDIRRGKPSVNVVWSQKKVRFYFSSRQALESMHASTNLFIFFFFFNFIESVTIAQWSEMMETQTLSLK